MDHLPVAHQHRPLEDVFQLPDVAGPVIAHEHVDGGRRDALDDLTVLVRELLEEVIGEQQQVGFALAERRHEDGEHVEPIVEVLAEGILRDGLLEILVRRGEQAHVGLDRFGAAQPLELALLQHAQQLDLRGGVDVADFVEEQCPALGELEAAFLPGLRPREGARSCPKSSDSMSVSGKAAQLTLTKGFFARSEL